jgi:hypothetical protein
MPKQELIIPEFEKKGFTCPHCNYNSQQVWGLHKFFNYHFEKSVHYAQCKHCDNFSIWYEEKMIYPVVTRVEDPNEDMPEDVKADYVEASLIVEKSPRAAAALLRLSIEKLCNHLGETGKINTMIKNLVEKGLSPDVQQALDSVRVIGDQAVHNLGEIDLRDDKETVYSLFRLINFICEDTLTRKKHIQQIYNRLPENKKKGIENRDKNS